LVSGESAQLQQVILIFATTRRRRWKMAGAIEITTELREVTEMRSLTHDELRPGRYVCIVVTDSGHGMDQATLARIFEPFFHHSRLGKWPWLGDGCARSYANMAESMNVESSPGHGSRFEIWLPSTESSASLPAIASPHGRVRSRAPSPSQGHFPRREW